MTAKALVSIVVTTRNSAKTLGACLESIRLQTYDNVELFVVDNASSDETIEIARRYTSRVYEFGPERSAQRNYALMNLARGTICGYIDSDMILGPRVVAEVVKTIAQGFVGVYVPEVILARGLYGRVRRFERSAYTGTAIDAVRFFKTDDFRRVGGFDESLPPGPEDWDLTISLKLSGSLAEISATDSKVDSSSWTLAGLCSSKGFRPRSLSSIYHDESAGSFANTVKKKMYYADGLDMYKKKWKSTSEDVNQQLSPLYRLFGVFFQRRTRNCTLGNFHLYAVFLFWKLTLAVRMTIRGTYARGSAGS